MRWTKELPLSLQCLFSVSFCPATSEEQSITLKPFTYEFQVENFFVSTLLRIAYVKWIWFPNMWKGKFMRYIKTTSVYLMTLLLTLNHCKARLLNSRTEAWYAMVELYSCHWTVGRKPKYLYKCTYVVPFFIVFLPSWACAMGTVHRLLSCFFPCRFKTVLSKANCNFQKIFAIKSILVVFSVLEMSSPNEIFSVF